MSIFTERLLFSVTPQAAASHQQVAYCTRTQAILQPPTSPEQPPVTPASQYNLFLYSLHNTSRFVELDQCVVFSRKGLRKGSCSAPSHLQVRLSIEICVRKKFGM